MIHGFFIPKTIRVCEISISKADRAKKSWGSVDRPLSTIRSAFVLYLFQACRHVNKEAILWYFCSSLSGIQESSDELGFFLQYFFLLPSFKICVFAYQSYPRAKWNSECLRFAWSRIFARQTTRRQNENVVNRRCLLGLLLGEVVIGMSFALYGGVIIPSRGSPLRGLRNDRDPARLTI